MKHLFTRQETIPFLLLLVAMWGVPSFSQAQFNRRYDLGLSGNSQKFESGGRDVQSIVFNDKESVFVGGESPSLQQPLLANFTLQGDFEFGTVFDIPSANIKRIEKIDQGLVAVGNVYSEKSGWDIMLLRTDEKGEPILTSNATSQWISFGGEQYDKVNDLIVYKGKDSKERIIMVGLSTSYANGQGAGGYILKTDSYGTLLESKIIDSELGIQSINSIIRSEDGNFLIAGRCDKWNLSVMKMNEDLKILWSKKIAISNLSDGILNAGELRSNPFIREDKDGNILVLATLANYEALYTSDFNYYVLQSVLFKLTSTGHPLLARSFQNKNSRYDLIPSDFEILYENEKAKYLINGRRHPRNAANSSSEFVMKIDEGFTIDWGHEYPQEDHRIATGGRGAISRSGTEYLLTGTNSLLQNLDKSLSLTKVSISDGSISSYCSSESLDLVRNNYFLDVRELPITREFLVNDYLEHRLTFNRIEINKLRGCWDESLSVENLNDSNNSSSGKSAKIYLQQNYPNPTNGRTAKVSYTLPDEAKSATIRIFNFNGKEVKAFSDLRSEGEIEVNTLKLPNGLYSYSLYVNGIRIETKKMVIDQ